VRSLPSKPVHEIMVPCTKFAFFEGELVGDAPLFVDVGADYIVERTAEQTCEIIERRRDLLREKIRDAERNAAEMESRLSAMEALEASGSGALATVREDEELVTDGRARISRKKDGSVEITEMYESVEDISAIRTLGASWENERHAADVVRDDLDDFIAKLEAMEMSERGEGAVEDAIEGDAYSSDSGDDDSDVDIDGGQPPDITCPEDFIKYDRWKAKRDAKTLELKAAAQLARERAQEELERNEREQLPKTLPVRAEVVERAAGEEVKEHNRPDEMRPLSLYQRKKLGLL